MCVRVLGDSECPWIIRPHPVKYTLRFLVTAFFILVVVQRQFMDKYGKKSTIIIINKKSAGNQRRQCPELIFLNHIISRDKKKKKTTYMYIQRCECFHFHLWCEIKPVIRHKINCILCHSYSHVHQSYSIGNKMNNKLPK